MYITLTNYEPSLLQVANNHKLSNGKVSLRSIAKNHTFVSKISPREVLITNVTPETLMSSLHRCGRKPRLFEYEYKLVQEQCHTIVSQIYMRSCADACNWYTIVRSAPDRKKRKPTWRILAETICQSVWWPFYKTTCGARERKICTDISRSVRGTLCKNYRSVR